MGCVTDILQPLIPRLRGKKSQKRLQKNCRTQRNRIPAIREISLDMIEKHVPMKAQQYGCLNKIGINVGIS